MIMDFPQLLLLVNLSSGLPGATGFGFWSLPGYQAFMGILGVAALGRQVSSEKFPGFYSKHPAHKAAIKNMRTPAKK